MITFLWWFGWLVAVAGNAFVISLFVVFGLAAAAGASTTSFIWFTAVCVGITLVLSVYLMLKQHYHLGILATVLWFPVAAIVGTTYGYLFKT